MNTPHIPAFPLLHTYLSNARDSSLVPNMHCHSHCTIGCLCGPSGLKARVENLRSLFQGVR